MFAAISTDDQTGYILFARRLMMPSYTYIDKDGTPLVTFAKRQAEKCPACGSTELKDKGSFSKCLSCGERIMDSEPINHVPDNE